MSSRRACKPCASTRDPLIEVPAADFALAVLKGLSHVAPHAHVLKLKNEDFSRDPKVVESMNNRQAASRGVSALDDDDLSWCRREMKRFAPCLVILVLAVAAPAWAGNEPEKAQRRVEEDVLPKIVLACGVPLSVGYDGDSLRKNNKDIGYDQTDGGNECDEPLRYLWYACGTDAGKAAVKAARISKVVCKGTAGAIGIAHAVGGHDHRRACLRGDESLPAQPQAVRGAAQGHPQAPVRGSLSRRGLARARQSAQPRHQHDHLLPRQRRQGRLRRERATTPSPAASRTPRSSAGRTGRSSSTSTSGRERRPASSPTFTTRGAGGSPTATTSSTAR